MQYWAAPRLEAACRIRFSLKKCWAICRPLPSSPRMALSGRRTSVNDTRPWSVGMLKVQRYSSMTSPSASIGVRNAVMPWPSPGPPEVLARIMSLCARWIPVFHVFSPLMTQPSPSRTALVSMWVASDPCSGSVIPKANPRVPSSRWGTHSAFCSSLPYSSISSRPTLLPTMECSFWRSLCSPRPRAARCSRMTAMPRLVPFLPPSSADSGYR